MNHLHLVTISYPRSLCQIFTFSLIHSHIKSVPLMINLSWGNTPPPTSSAWLAHKKRKSHLPQCVSCTWWVSFSIFWDEEWGKSHPGCAGLENLFPLFLCAAELRLDPADPSNFMIVSLCLIYTEHTVNHANTLKSNVWRRCFFSLQQQCLFFLMQHKKRSFKWCVFISWIKWAASWTEPHLSDL